MELAIATCVMWCVLFTLISTRFHPPRSTDRRLDSTLAKARSLGVDVFILGHIAPGASHIDWNSMAALGWAGGGWTDYSQRRFYRTVRSYADVVRGQFFGHLHTGSIRLLNQGTLGTQGALPRVIYLSPSLTPRNPTPHMPAVRLYRLAPAPWAVGVISTWTPHLDSHGDVAVTAQSPHGVISGYAMGSHLEIVDAWDHVVDIDASNARQVISWSVHSLREEHNLSSLSPDAVSGACERLVGL
mmetsp:Transcript_24685/g.56198  ORF Transcript_24685/g.56198 Transcript_24685/m.56198 type:complete len:243 (+) Transcript_24685:1011-1739(+)